MRVLLGLMLPGLMAAAIVAASIPSARAEEWCGFQDKAGSRVRCGFSSVTECKQAIGDKKDAVCMPSPSFAGRQQAAAQG